MATCESIIGQEMYSEQFLQAWPEAKIVPDMAAASDLAIRIDHGYGLGQTCMIDSWGKSDYAETVLSSSSSASSC